MGTYNKSKYPTFTKFYDNSEERLVPWLASFGPLAFSPERPPNDESLFRYYRVLPSLFKAMPRPEEEYFGGIAGSTSTILDFWRFATERQLRCIAKNDGHLTPTGLSAPIAIYSTDTGGPFDTYLFVLQHGSYQILEKQQQPFVEDGFFVCYRGVRNDEQFCVPGYQQELLNPAEKEAVRRYYLKTFLTMSDSVHSFLCVHAGVCLVRTDHLVNFRSLAMDSDDFFDVGTQHIFEFFRWIFNNQCFSFRLNTASGKFGPNYFKIKTPIDNVWITSLFAGEAELKLINPNRVEILEANGCVPVETEPREFIEIPNSYL